MLQKSIPHHLATYQVFASTCSLALRVRSPMVVRSSDFSRITVAAVSRSAQTRCKIYPCPRELSLQNLSLLSDAQNTSHSLWFAMCLTGKPWFYLRWKTHHSIPVRQALPQLTSAVMALADMGKLLLHLLTLLLPFWKFCSYRFTCLAEVVGVCSLLLVAIVGFPCIESIELFCKMVWHPEGVWVIKRACWCGASIFGVCPF